MRDEVQQLDKRKENSRRTVRSSIDGCAHCLLISAKSIPIKLLTSAVVLRQKPSARVRLMTFFRYRLSSSSDATILEDDASISSRPNREEVGSSTEDISTILRY